MRINDPFSRRWKLTETWKISISTIAIHVYRSPVGAFIGSFGQPYDEYGTKTMAIKKARQLAGRMKLRLFTE